MPLKIPRIIGHRGAAGYAPENTLEGIYTAADMETSWIELDVKLTKDQIPIIFHDDTLERTTNGSGNVADMTFEDIRQLEAGSWFSDSFAGIQIPTLEEAIDAILECNLGLNLEIKPCLGREKETAEVALDILSQIWDDHDRLLISSFSHIAMETALDMAHDWHRGFLLPEEWPENWEDIARYLEISAFHVNGHHCTPEHIKTLLRFEKPILAYTINEPEQAQILQQWGVDGFFSDTPDVISESLLQPH
ncbi:MAG: glycerophosphoryl diester phosphodiesterase [Alphaproteobacteria bacterium]|nr:glycerophosphoryl diester phosphodiesterase [Alphaproteobacteria bacterium]